MRAALLVMLAAGTANADRWSRLANDGQGASWLHYELTALHDTKDTMTAPKATDLVLAGARLHGVFSENSTVAYHVGLDLAAGSTLRGAGLAYDVALFPVGVALRFGETSMLALGGGLGAMGAVGTIDDAMMFPIEANLEVGGSWRLLARARAVWVVGADGRKDGAPSLPFGDELDATVGIRLGHHYEDFGFPSGNGYFIGGSYREMTGSRFVGLTIGYSIDLGTPRGHAHRLL